jgi:thiol-disulfide isomerase/thioredoxin
MLSKLNIFIFSAFCLFLASCSNQQDQTQTLPLFSTHNLLDKQINSIDLKKNMVIVNFWATSCAACIDEMPKFKQIYNKYKNKGLIMLAVAMPYDAPFYVKNFSKSHQLPFDVILDAKGDMIKAFGEIQVTPTTFLYINNKRVAKIIGEPNWLEFEAEIANAKHI